MKRSGGRRGRLIVNVAGACALAAVLAGCQGAHVANPLTSTLGGSAPETQVEFWHELADRKVTSNDDAFHGLLLFLDGKDDAKDYNGRVAALKATGILSKSFNQPADAAITRGTMSIAIVKILKIRGGVMMTLTGGVDGRYTTRELVDQGIYPASSPNQTFSGAEFVGIIGKMEDYQRGGEENVPFGLQAVGKE